MPNPDPNAEPSLKDILAAVTSLRGDFDKSQQIQSQLVDAYNQQIDGRDQEQEDPREQLEAFNNATDEELAAYNQQNGTNITRAEIDGAVSDYNANIGEEQGDQGQRGDQHAEGAQGQQGQQMAGAAAGGGAETAAAFSALNRELIQLKARVNARDAKEIQLAENAEFDKFNQKMEALVEFGERSVKQIELLEAERDALKLHVRTGTRPAPAGIDNGTRLFGANGEGGLHPYQEKLIQLKAKDAKLTDGQAIKLADKDDQGALHASYLQSLSEARAIRAIRA